jgi:hypothetical protein
MATVLASQSLAALATVTSTSQAYVASSVVTASCLNGTPGPGYSCIVQLFVSVDNVNFSRADQRLFGMGPGLGYVQVFELARYAGAEFGGAPNAMDRIGGVGPLTNFKLTFIGAPDVAVTVAAVSAP